MIGFLNRLIPVSLIAVLALAPLAATAQPSPAINGFFESIDDLPLMPGLTELTDQTLSFDQANGRIVSTAATGAPAIEAVQVFYEDTLPSLNWRPRSVPMTYRRGDEQLSLKIGKDEQTGLTRLEISITPLAE